MIFLSLLNQLILHHLEKEIVYFSIEPFVIVVTSPENKTYDSSNILFSVELDKEVSEIIYSLDGYENITFTEDLVLSDLEVGAHSVVVFATDITGHTGVSAIIYFSIELFPTTIAVASITTITIIGILVYFKKYRN